MNLYSNANHATLFKAQHDGDVAMEVSKLLPACLACIDCKAYYAARFEGKGNLKIDVLTLCCDIMGPVYKETLSSLVIKLTDELCKLGFRVVQNGYDIEIIWHTDSPR